MLGFFVSVCVIGRCGRLPVGGWLGYRGGCRKAKRDSNGLSRPSHEAENNSLPQSLDTPRIKKRIPFRYLGHPTKPKTTLYLNLRTLRETKNESQFRSPGTMQSKKRISILTSEYSVKRKMNYDFTFGVSGKPKMNCDFAFWVLRKAKMNLDFASRSVRKPKMNCDFASLSIRSRQNEL